VDVDLADAYLQAINTILGSFPVSGDRYPAAVTKLTEY
jgi:hypothetical protein